MVFVILVLTTVPVSVRWARLRSPPGVRPAAARSSLRSCCARGLLALHRLHARDVAAHLAELVRLRSLTGRLRHAQVELLAAQLEQFLAQLRGALLTRSSFAFISAPAA